LNKIARPYELKITSVETKALGFCVQNKQTVKRYRISRPIRRNFFPEKCDLNSTCVLCAQGKCYFQTYKYPYIYYTTSLSWDSENSHEDGFNGSDDDFLGFYDE